MVPRRLGHHIQVGLLAAAMAPRWLIALATKLRPDVLYRVHTREQVIALTLDDGPCPETTPSALRALQDHGARATFFLLGESAAHCPTLVSEIVESGNELGNHTWLDRSAGKIPHLEIAADIRASEQAIGLGARVKYLRPGAGRATRAIRSAARECGYRCVVGSVYAHDARITAPEVVAQAMLKRVRPGDILVLHERRASSLQALYLLLEGLQERHLAICSITELLERSD
jgi:peptidoglycan/xylan/chitin deacetylase (PgdA/CDA1 family)